MYFVFSHNDLDGYSVNTIVNFYNCIKTFNIRNVSNAEIENEIVDFLTRRDYFKYKYVFVVDFNLSSELIKKIYDYTENFVILDHHDGLSDVIRFPWIKIDNQECGSSLFYKYLINNKIIKKEQIMDNYIEGVRLYDTGEYLRTSKQNNIQYIPEELNKIFLIYKENFPQYICSNIKNGNKLLNIKDKEIAKNILKNEEIYANRKAKDMKCVEYKNYNIGLLFIDQISELNKVYYYCSKIYPTVDIFLIINVFSYISLRSTKPNINLCKIFESYGAKGHKLAAGMPYNNDLIIKLLKIK